MDFQFQYRITYGNGQCYDRNEQVLTVPISMDEYKEIIQGVLAGKQIEEINGISETIEKMIEFVQDHDRWIHVNGTQRTTPLKKARVISELKFFMPVSEINRLRKMKNPMEVLERAEEHMTIYRNDGSSVIISYAYGQVKVIDSRRPSSYTTCEADHFISKMI